MIQSLVALGILLIAIFMSIWRTAAMIKKQDPKYWNDLSNDQAQERADDAEQKYLERKRNR